MSQHIIVSSISAVRVRDLNFKCSKQLNAAVYEMSNSSQLPVKLMVVWRILFLWPVLSNSLTSFVWHRHRSTKIRLLSPWLQTAPGSYRNHNRILITETFIVLSPRDKPDARSYHELWLTIISVYHKLIDQKVGMQSKSKYACPLILSDIALS